MTEPTPIDYERARVLKLESELNRLRNMLASSEAAVTKLTQMLRDNHISPDTGKSIKLRVASGA